MPRASHRTARRRRRCRREAPPRHPTADRPPPHPYGAARAATQQGGGEPRWASRCAAGSACARGSTGCPTSSRLAICAPRPPASRAPRGRASQSCSAWARIRSRSGLGPLIVDLIERERVAAVAMNGACLVHDFELAWGGQTSEDVGPGLDRRPLRHGARDRRVSEPRHHARASPLASGLGPRRRRRHRRRPAAASADSASWPPRRAPAFPPPCTSRSAPTSSTCIPTPTAPRSARRACATSVCSPSVVGGLDGGVYVNLGSAVVMPEVFVKALNLARNVGQPVRRLTTDRHGLHPPLPPGRERRRTADGDAAGAASSLTGHHEIMFPLLWAAVEEALRVIDAHHRLRAARSVRRHHEGRHRRRARRECRWST